MCVCVRAQAARSCVRVRKRAREGERDCVNGGLAHIKVRSSTLDPRFKLRRHLLPLTLGSAICLLPFAATLSLSRLIRTEPQQQPLAPRQRVRPRRALSSSGWTHLFLRVFVFTIDCEATVVWWGFALKERNTWSVGSPSYYWLFILT